ncbi:MAG: inositol monophosphatase family protein [Hyphomicrobiaceae bacterium]
MIRHELGARFPGHGIIGEEYGVTRGDAEYCWIVDPIDGTRSFVMGLPTWGTLIGLSRNGEPLLGLVNQPFTGERFWNAGRTAHYRGQTAPAPSRRGPAPISARRSCRAPHPTCSATPSNGSASSPSVIAPA